MTVSKTTRPHDALQQLLDERKRYEQWIATLESRRASTPEHVFKRVHGDYDQRLAAVRAQLVERTGEIRSAIASLKDRLKQATEQETERVDELHEAELRSLVGELTPEQWELRKREVEMDLKKFVDEKKTISAELDQLLLVMEQTVGDDAPAVATAAPAPAANPAGHVEPEFTPAEPAPVPSTPPPAAPAPADNTRVRSKTPSKARAAIGSDTAPPVFEKAPVPIESLAPRDEPAPLADNSSKDDVRANQAKRGRAEPVSAAPDSRRESEKTLKCAECGAMNYPTEWYCESCGGELSAL